MSEVIGQWIIVIQDAMPGELRNSEKWKSLLPLAAGTGRDREQERLKIILDWIWGTVLPSLQPLADQRGFGEQWQKMTTERTANSANAATNAAEATWAARAAAVARAVARAAAMAAAAAAAEATAVEAVARAAAMAAAAAGAGANFDPCGLLERLIKIDNNAQGAA
jgi:hypothetical protein